MGPAALVCEISVIGKSMRMRSCMKFHVSYRCDLLDKVLTGALIQMKDLNEVQYIN